MTDTPKITKEEQISFEQFHEPKLKSGDYTVEVTQTLNQAVAGTTANTTKLQQVDQFSTKKRLYVAGERFSIPKDKIYSCFPPQGNNGDHSNDLPSIMLTRSTLPWERFAQLSSVPERSLTMPWLYLFVFDDNDIKNGVVKVSSKAIQDVVEFATRPGLPTDTTKIGLESEPGEVSGTAPNQTYNPAKVSVVEIDAAWAKQYNIFPTTIASGTGSYSDLGLMTGVRLNKKSTTTTEPDSEMAICIANRLPAPGVKSYGHLLSLENRVDTSGINLTDQGYDGSTFTSFISLTDWSFTCTPESGETFSELLNGLNQNNLGLPPLDTSVAGAATANEYLNKGAVALPHHLKEGGTAVSWYHGPLVGGSGSASVSQVSFPVQQSDDLLLLDSNLGMLNTSYAAAWELGKMLTLNNKSISMEMYAWKRQLAWEQNQSAADANFHDLQPANKRAAIAQGKVNQWNKIEDWLQSLNLLENIPFNYLLPDETLLPAESIRFFELDQFWISSLLDGAFSIGRVSANESAMDTAALAKINTAKYDTVSGFLLRSQVVSGWPALEVEAPSAIPTESAPDPSVLPLLKMERLGPDILICLFEGEASFFDIHLKPESIHFGFNRPADPATDPNGYTKDIRFKFPSTGIEQVPDTSPISTPIVWRKYTTTPRGNTDGADPNPNRSVDLISLLGGMESSINSSNAAIAKKNSQPTPAAVILNAAQFAMEMVKGVPRVFFSKGTPGALTGPEYQYHAPAAPTNFGMTENAGAGGLGFNNLTGYRAIPNENPINTGDVIQHDPTDPGATPSHPTDPGSSPSHPADPGAPSSDPTDPGGSPTHPTDPGAPPTHPADPGASPATPQIPLETPEVPDAEIQTHKGLFGKLEGDVKAEFEKAKGSVDGDIDQAKDHVDGAVDQVKGDVDNAENTRKADMDKLMDELKGLGPKLSGEIRDGLQHKMDADKGLASKVKDNLKQDIQKSIDDIKGLEPEVTDEVKEKLDEIKDKIDASPIFNLNSARVRKAWVVTTLILLVVSTILFTVTTIIDRERPKPLVFHFQGIKEMQEIEFVKQDYEELVPIATKDGELEFLLTVPASVSGKMDMTMMEYTVEGDSVIKVTLPNPIVSDPVLNLAEVKDYYDRGGGDKLFLSGGGASYSKAYEQIISAMEDTKKGILASAVKDDIIEQTNKKARAYLINMAGVTGYRIEFVLKEPDPSWEDDMKKRLGKTYDKVKNKVEGHSGILKRIKDDLTKKKSDDTKTESK